MKYHHFVATSKGGPEVLEWQEFGPGPHSGKLKPEIGEVVPLQDAPRAQQRLLDYEVQGKVVLVSG